MEEVDVVGAVKEARAHSDVMRGLELAQAVGSRGVRLTDGQITELESRGNTSSDWSRVMVAPSFNAAFVRDSHFQGDVYLGTFGRPVPVAQGLKLASGVYGVRVADAAIDDGALVLDTRLVARAVVGAGAVVIGVGEILGQPNSRFGLGIAVRVGVETGGREVAVYPEITVPVAARVATDRREARMLAVYSDAVRSYTDALVSDVTLIGPGVRVLHTPSIRASFVGDRALVDGALGIDGSVILSSEREPTEISFGAFVRRSIIQWGCRITTHAIVDESAILERSSVGRHGKVTSSILGPCSVVEKGELSASLIGPLTSMHHQSLLLAALWPDGRGNVGAGALIGSNHTSRAADQEILPCEGAFFGLGSRFKFPSDFSKSPYTVFASGVDVNSQRVAFPFSLIRAAKPKLISRLIDAGEDPLPDTNEIVPAWVLIDSPYTLARTEWKFRNRYRAQRQQIDPDPLRPRVLAMCRDALDRLESVPRRDLYTRDHVAELGSNVMTEVSRVRAVDAYSAALVAASLAGLFKRLAAFPTIPAALGDAAPPPVDGTVPEADDAVDGWRLHRSVLGRMRPGVPLRRLLAELIESRAAFVAAVESSKAKDDRRGEEIIPGYGDAHPRAADDRVVQAVAEDLTALRSDVEQFCGRLDGDGPCL